MYFILGSFTELKNIELNADYGDTYQTLHFTVSDLGRRCLPKSLGTNRLDEFVVLLK